MIAKYSYDEFGIPSPASKFDSHTHHGNVYGFTGEQWDQVAGLLYLRARYYIPDVGRFISKDSFREYFPANPRFLPSYISVHSILTTSGSISLGIRLLDYVQSRATVSPNFYLYCKNNPTIFVDQTGCDWISVGLAVIGGGLTIVGAVTTAPAWVTAVGIGLSATAIFYSTYRYWKGEQRLEEHILTTTLSAGAGIPYVGLEFIPGAIITEVALTTHHSLCPSKSS